MRKFLSLISILIPIAACYFLIIKEESLQKDAQIQNPNNGSLEISSTTITSEEIIGKLIQTDLENLFGSKYLDERLQNVSKIWFSVRTPKIKNTIQKVDPFLKTKDSGLYFLTIDIYEFPDEQNESYLLQFNWVNSKTGDKEYEMSRVYKTKKNVVIKKPIKNIGKK